MEATKITWVKKWFDGRRLLYRNGTYAGFLVNHAFKMKYTGELSGQRIFMKTKGFFQSSLEILNADNEKTGEVNFNFWNSRAKIVFGSGETYDFAFTNLFHLNWMVTGPGKTFRYTSSLTNGSIEFEGIPDEKLALTGLAIQKYLSEMTLLALVPVFITIIIASGQ